MPPKKAPASSEEDSQESTASTAQDALIQLLTQQIAESQRREKREEAAREEARKLAAEAREEARQEAKKRDEEARKREEKAEEEARRRDEEYKRHEEESRRREALLLQQIRDARDDAIRREQELREEAQERENRLERALLEAAQQQEPTAQDSPSGTRTPSGTGHRKKIDTPSIGSPNDTTLSDLKDYQRRVAGYRNLQKLDVDLDKKGRIQLLALGVHKDWLDLRDDQNRLIVDEENDDLEDMLAKMRMYLRLHRNPLLDRLAFLARNQKEGEKIDEYYAALRTMDAECDFDEKLTCLTCGEDSQLSAKIRDERLRDPLSAVFRARTSVKRS